MPASTPPSRKRGASLAGAPGTRQSDGTDVLQVLVFQKRLTSEQVDPIRRTARTKSVSVEQAIIDLGLLSEVQIAESLASHAGLRFIKINPLDLDLDVVTTALSGPFARRHGLIAISKNATTLTVAVQDPLAPFPERRHPPRDRAGCGAGGGHPQRRGSAQPRLLRTQDQPQERRAATGAG